MAQFVQSWSGRRRTRNMDYFGSGTGSVLRESSRTKKRKPQKPKHNAHVERPSQSKMDPPPHRGGRDI